jgi:hypothetical protein
MKNEQPAAMEKYMQTLDAYILEIGHCQAVRAS